MSGLQVIVGRDPNQKLITTPRVTEFFNANKVDLTAKQLQNLNQFQEGSQNFKILRDALKTKVGDIKFNDGDIKGLKTKIASLQPAPQRWANREVARQDVRNFVEGVRAPLRESGKALVGALLNSAG